MTTKDTDADIRILFDNGAHYGYSKTRRHPSSERFLYGNKDRHDIFDLVKTNDSLKRAREFVAKIASEGKEILFVGGKSEAAERVEAGAKSVGLPYVSGRWIGGTLTNFSEIKKRTARLETLRNERDLGERDKYTKLERLMMDREIEELERRFGGIAEMKDLPAALFIVDTRHESTAVREALELGIPMVGLANSDCDFGRIEYPIPANDSVSKSIAYFVGEIAKAYSENRKSHSVDSNEKNSAEKGE